MNRKKMADTREETVYHDTQILLKTYREAVWSLEVSVRQAKQEFHKEYGNTIEEFLDSVYSAGAELTGTKLENQAKCIERSHKMLEMINSAVEILRYKHMNGEIYYWILYYTYLSPQRLPNVEAIMEKIRPYSYDCSRCSYFKKRREAIDALGAILWGYTNNECQKILDKLILPGEE